MLDVLAGVHLEFFHSTNFESSEHSKKKRCKTSILCLGLVGARHPEELEQPVLNSWSRRVRFLSTFSVSFLEILWVYV